MFPPNEHAPLSPSRLHRIITCPGSYKFGKQCEDEQEEQQSPYAEEGSMLHARVESLIVDKEWKGPELDLDQMNAVNDAYNYYEILKASLSGQPGFTQRVEKRVYLKEWHASLYECSGTCDLIFSTNTALHVVDWKFGQGVPVYAEDNDQLYAYAAGAAVNHQGAQQFESIVIHCIQPRLDSYDTHELSPKQLIQWINGRLIPGCTEAVGDIPRFNPEPKACRWCPAKMKCRARYNKANTTAADVFASVAKIPDQVTKEELSKLYARAKELDRYIKDIGAHIQHMLQAGDSWPGYKLVAGRSIRKWAADQEATIEGLLANGLEFDEIFEHKLISPAKAEKLDRSFKASERFQSLIEKPEGSPTLVEESDKRPAISFRTASEIFKGLEV